MNNGCIYCRDNKSQYHWSGADINVPDKLFENCRNT